MFTGGSRAALLLAALAMFVLVPSAVASSLIGVFDAEHGATIGWVKGEDAPGDHDGYAIKMTVPSDGAATGAFAAFVYASPPRNAPATAPSFKVRSNVTGPASGSPRLIISFDNGNLIYAAPDSWTAGVWASVGGGAPDWSESGTASGCISQTDVTYADALSCNKSQGVSEVYMVDDTPGSNLYVDDVSSNGTLITEPASVKAAHATRTSLASKVNVSAGVGSLTATCGLTHRSCRFSLTLRAKDAGHTVKVGTINGKVAPQTASQVTVKLNATGRHLLSASHTLVVKVTGQWPKGRGFHRKSLTING